MVTLTISLIPQGGAEADRVSMPAHTVMFGTGKADLANNVLRIGEKSFQLDSLQFDTAAVAAVVPPVTPPPAEKAAQ